MVASLRTDSNFDLLSYRPEIPTTSGGSILPVSDLQREPRFVLLAGKLLLIAAKEEAQSEQNRANAWAQKIFFSPSDENPSWVSFSKTLEAALTSADLTMQKLNHLVEGAPNPQSSAFGELSVILQETSKKIMAEKFLQLARGNIRQNISPQLTQELLHLAQQIPSTQERASATLSILAGGGSFAEQLDYKLPQMVRELYSPLMLASYGSAVWSAERISAFILSNSGRTALLSLAASETAALAVEVPALVMTRRLGAQIFLGGEDLFSATSLRQELSQTYGCFAMLRGAGNVFEFITPALRSLGGLNRATGELSRVGHLTLFTARLATDVTAVMAGSSATQLSFNENLFNTLLTVGHMRVAGNVLGGMREGNHSLALQKQTLLEKALGDLSQTFFGPFLRINFGLEPIGPKGVFQENKESNQFYTKADSSEPPGPEVPPHDTPTGVPSSRWEQIRKNAIDYLHQYGPKRESRNTLVGKVAARTYKILVRFGQQPDLKDAAIDAELKALEPEVAKVAVEQSKVKLIVSRLMDSLSRFKSATPDPDNVAKAQKEIAQDEAGVGRIAENLPQLWKLIKAAREQGLNDILRVQLAQTLDRLDWKVPGLERIRKSVHGEELQRDRAEGALLGLALEQFQSTDSTIANELKGATSTTALDLDLELDFLHYSLLLSARQNFDPVGLSEKIEEIAQQYQASEDSTAAMVLFGEALSKLHREGATPDLLGHLRNHPLGQGMSETFRMISALNDPVIAIEDGIASLGHSAPYGPQIEASRGPKAGEYFATGLFLYLRMQENPKEFVEILRMAHQTKNQGFHPSIAASLFGAANGRSRLPVELLPDPPKIHSFLEKANAKE